MVSHAIGGENRLKNFRWNLGRSSISSRNWVGADEVENSVKDFLSAMFPKEPTSIRKVRAVVYENKCERDPKYLTPEEISELLIDAFDVVKNEHNEQANENGEQDDAGGDPDAVDDEPVSVQKNGLLTDSQIDEMFSHFGRRWLEVPFLVRYVEGLTSDVKSSDPKLIDEKKYERLLEIAERLRSVHDSCDDRLWCLIPTLSSAYDILFEVGVVSNRETLKNIVKTRVYGLWMKLHETLSTSPLLTSGKADDRIVAFMGFALSKSVCEHLRRGWARRMSRETASAEDMLVIVKNLLALTPCAWHLSLVRDNITKSRDDILSEFLLQGGNVQIEGVFASGSDQAQRPIRNLSTTLHLRSSALQVYTGYCLNLALDRSSSVFERSKRMQEFVTAPVTDYRDILKLLKQFKEGPLLEAIMFGVFDLDASWRVLAFLMRPSVIASGNQRTTAGLLDRLGAQMHATDVTRVMSVLLQDGPRKDALSVYLQKSIVRSLFDIESDGAGSLILKEWDRPDLHVDVRYELVVLAVHIFTDSLKGDRLLSAPILGTTWKILESAAATPDLELDAAILLTTPCWMISSRALCAGLSSPPYTTWANKRLRAATSPDVEKTKFRQVLDKQTNDSGEARPSMVISKLRSDESYRTRLVDRYGQGILGVLAMTHHSPQVRILARCRRTIFDSTSLVGHDNEATSALLLRLREELQLVLSTDDHGDVILTSEVAESTGDDWREAIYPSDETAYMIINLTSQIAAITFNSIQETYHKKMATVSTSEKQTQMLTEAIDKSMTAKVLVDLLKDTTKELLQTPPSQIRRVVRLSAVLSVALSVMRNSSVGPLDDLTKKALTKDVERELGLLRTVSSFIVAN